LNCTNGSSFNNNFVMWMSIVADIKLLEKGKREEKIVDSCGTEFFYYFYCCQNIFLLRTFFHSGYIYLFCSDNIEKRPSEKFCWESQRVIWKMLMICPICCAEKNFWFDLFDLQFSLYFYSIMSITYSHWNGSSTFFFLPPSSTQMYIMRNQIIEES